MPAYDYNRFIEFYNAEGKDKERRRKDGDKRSATERARQDRRVRR